MWQTIAKVFRHLIGYQKMLNFQFVMVGLPQSAAKIHLFNLNISMALPSHINLKHLYASAHILSTYMRSRYFLIISENLVISKYLVWINHQVFHICWPKMNELEEVIGMNQWSFICGNQTVFDQSSLTCNHVSDAFPCEESESLFNRSKEKRE